MKKEPLGKNLSGRREKELFQAIVSMKSASELERLMADLCTPAEIRAMADRWQVAVLVDQSVPYREIQEITGVSTATVTRVARSLAQGRGGYRLALDHTRK